MTAFVPSTLFELLRWRAEQLPDRLAYRFLSDDGTEEFEITYSELDRQARAIGAWLESFNARGERALLLYPSGLEFIAAFFGCMYAGVIAVPAYPPRLNRPDPRLQSIVTDSGATIGLTVSSILSNLERRFANEPAMAALRWLNTETPPTHIEAGWREPDVAADALAFLQFTSGSTSAPKGVMLTHGNLMHNLEAIWQGFRMETTDSGAFWLPSYHDMGFIGGVLEPMYVPVPSTLMSPAAFLQRPARWLEAITRYRATVTGAPNFAFDLCVEKITPEQRAAIDLSHLKLLFCGAEPIRRETLDRFADAFAPCGFRRDAFYPCYGLAESTLLVTGGDGPGALSVRSFRKSALKNSRAVEVDTTEADAQTMVSCGIPQYGQKIVIANPETMRPCAPDEIGEIWVQGGSVAKGYWNQPDATAQTFHARLADSGEGPFLRTGDLGFLRDGDLYVTGRLKDLIIIRGRNHYPQDIELTVEQCHPALQPGAGAAISVDVDGQERLVIVQEVTRKDRKPDVNEVAAAVRRAVAEHHELQTYAVVLIKPLSALKTSSGKIQRHACKAAFLDGALEVVGEWRAKIPAIEIAATQSEVGLRRLEIPATEVAATATRSEVGLRRLESAKADFAPRVAVAAILNRRIEIQNWLIAHIASRVGLSPDDMDITEPFTYFGLDSATAVNMAGDLSAWLGRSLPPTLAWDYPTIESLAEHLATDNGRMTKDEAVS
ncbi:MAG: AMP-binding protein [Chloroflexota bacterium]